MNSGAAVQKAVKTLQLTISVMLVHHIRAVAPPSGEVEQSMLGNLQLRENQLMRSKVRESSSHPCSHSH